MDRDLLRVSGRLSSMCLKLQTFKWKQSRKATCSVREENPQDGNNLFMMQNSNRPPRTHTPPAPPPPLPTYATSFLISDYIDSTCFGMLNSPYTRIALAITKAQQSSTLRFLNRALSHAPMHALRI